MKNIIMICLLFFVSVNINAQIGKTKTKIIEDNGTNYTVEEVEEKYKDEVSIIKYEKEVESSISEDKIKQIKKFEFFKNKETNEYICFRYAIEEPLSEINSWIIGINSEGYVRVGELKWKDYEYNVVYKIIRNEKYEKCVILVYYDPDEE